ncbi:acetoin dehydrogenase dihydrolipoyllysine-residue acetyltransferase subunit [Prauserella muralis]|uniref:Acetoin dehydrogenase dihydrolipoyllysine-residue acetyltransferase subunit n=1 Tax=Prauserella muralis TaxID=588067 RepID=A0A2V4B7Q2_9PSEU|nr:acetoin dehydrogenase dihydrolipoyllysine-residue acetyltransferase subunit [Prauserella muralis]PXY31354.1 acetoin dehydrogenase dihydrolipoyllysine-residue acetyltransferase subunit [Prauserella muralis]TWE14324.1 pyruvate dehydrogenase E2 component (dihydrolipoamide acetyltransferase) [Prauserella muralis]
MNDAIRKVVMPKWGLSMATGKITEWIAAEGDEIASGDELADIDTDKIAGSLESADEGVLRRIVANVGEDVPVGGTIALIAPADVPESDIDEAARLAREELDSGAVEEVAGPVTGTVEVEGRTLAYATLGDGEEHVVLVHGYGGDKNSWLFVQEPLSEHRTVHALDLPGHGESVKDVGDGSLDTLAGAVLGFLEAKGIARAHLVGHSLGGAVVTAAAAREPGRVASLTLVAPAGFGSEINAEYLRGFASASSRRELKPHLTALFADSSQVTRQLADDLMKYKRLDGVDKALNTLLGTLLDGDRPGIDAAPLLSTVEVPVAVVWGRADAVLPPANASGLGEVAFVDDAGHMVHMEQPGAVVSAVGRVAGDGG